MRCGFYETEITPPIGGDIPGYYAHRYTTGVRDRLYAKAAVFEGEETAAIVVIDAVELTREFCEAVQQRASEFTGIPAANIAVSANHSHYGIPIGDVISDVDENYMEVATRLIADTVTLAWQRRQPCKLTYGIGRAEGVAYVRDYVLENGAVVTNAGKFIDQVVRPYSEPDEDLPVLTAYDEEGRPMGALFTLALHQDTTGGLEFSGDYSSETARQLKAQYGQGFVSMYLPGCSGDINHGDLMGKKAMLEAIAAGEDEATAALKYKKNNHIAIGKVVAREAIRVIEEASAPVEGERVAVLREDLVLERRHATEEELAHARWVAEDRMARKDPYDMTGQNSNLMIAYEEEFGGEKTVEFPLHTMLIGDVWLYATPGEIYHQFGEKLKERTPGGKWLIAELCNTTGGYLPTPELFGTHIYPAQLCHGSFIVPEGGDQIVEAFAGMIQEVNQ